MTHWKIISPRKDYIYYCSLQSLVVMTFRRRMCTGQSIVLVVLIAHRHILQSILFRWEQCIYQDNLKGCGWRPAECEGLVLVLVLVWPSGWRFSNGDHGHHQHLVLDWVRDHQDGVLVMVMVLAWPSTVKMGGRASWYACLCLDRHVRAPTN